MQSNESPGMGRVYFFLVLTTVFWGGSFLFSKIGLREFHPLWFVLSRFVLATSIMLIVFGHRLKQLTWPTVRRGVIVGFALGITNITFVFGISGTSISRAGVLNNLFILFIPLVTRLVWKERVGRINLAGIALAAAGIWLLATGGEAGLNQGDLVSTLCAFFIACHIIAVSKVLKDDDVYLVSVVQFATVAIMAAAATFFTDAPLAPVSTLAMIAVLFCALFPTIFCFTIQNRYQRYVTPTRAGLIYTLDPVWSLVAGYFVLGEVLSGVEWFGCGMIFLAVLLPLVVRYCYESDLIKKYRLKV
jgi:drug/metabolite transporter (DMT)-like permease